MRSVFNVLKQFHHYEQASENDGYRLAVTLLQKTKKIFSALTGLTLLITLLPAYGHSEVYVAGLGAYVNPMDFSDVGLEDGAMAGAKLGYNFSSLNWLGIETEGLFTTIQFSDQGQNSSTGNLSGADDLEVTTWAFNVIFRYPGERFQPYFGGGLGLYFTELTLDNFGTATDGLVPGFNGLAGIRAFLNESKSVAFFAEYKFNYAQLNFSYPATSTQPSFEVDGTYWANIAAAGFSIHFDIFPKRAL